MLKVLASSSVISKASAKCGEIFCQSDNEFTIMCNFCNMKIFEFEDFVLHFKNMHFANGLLKTDQLDAHCSAFRNTDIKNEMDALIDNSTFTTLDECSSTDQSNDDDDVTHATLMNWRQASNGEVCDEPALYNDEKEAPDAECRTDDDNDDADYQPICAKRSKGDAATHKSTVKTKTDEVICDQCSKSYKSFATLRAHIKLKHEAGKDGCCNASLLHCAECKMEFNSSRALDKHQREEHGGYKCSHCDKRYLCKRQLSGHVSRHSGIKNFNCDIPDCNKKFYDQRSLANHKRNTHSNFKKFICDICGYSCRIKESLRVHYRSHTGEKPYVCEICNRCFASNSLLKEHQPMHTSERPHKCETCNAAFSRPKALYHHRFLHLGVKKFKCKLCGNAYAQLAGLAGHMRKHKEGLF